MKKLREDFIMPILVLCAICLLCTAAVAATFQATEPEIARMRVERALAARIAVLPEADEFLEFVNGIDVELPPGVLEAFRAQNETGFVFQTYARGYAGLVPVMVGLDTDGFIVGIQMLSNRETPGIGDLVENPAYLALFHGLDSPDGVHNISGATVTVDALKNALRHAIAAFELVRDLEPSGAAN